MPKDKEETLLDCLEDKKFIKKLQQVLSPWLKQELSALQAQIEALDKENKQGQAGDFYANVDTTELEKLQTEVEKLQQLLQQSQLQCQKLEVENSKLKLSLQQSNEQLSDFEAENTELKQSLQESSSKFAQQKADLTNSRNEVAAVKKKLKASEVKLQEMDEKAKELALQLCEEKQTNKNLQAQLERCFAKGQEIYAKLSMLTPTTEKLLKSIIPGDGLEAFIVAGAQEQNLAKLWDEMACCLNEGREEDVSVLWPCFVYFVELVNMSHAEPLYAIASVKEGDCYDMDLHYNDRQGTMQGEVQKIRLLGYNNIFTQKIIKRSIVTLCR